MSLAQSKLQIEAIKTTIYKQHENLIEFICSSLDSNLICEGMVLVITSKIVSLAENRLISASALSKEALVQRESDIFLGEIGYSCFLTIKEGLFIASAGIDESNSENSEYILYPKNPFESAQRICDQLKEKWNLKELGIILSDSHTTPLRKGVTGIALSHWGFKGIKNLVGQEDLFHRKLKMTQINIADALASAAVLLMGEGSESCPLALIKGANLEFVDKVDPLELRIPFEEDLYYPIFKNFIEEK